MSSNRLKNTRDKKVTIEGVAANAKAGAVVMPNEDEVVYLAGMNEWPDDFADQRVVVEGILRRGQVYPDVEHRNGITSQGLPGEQWFLEVENYRLA